MMVCEGVGIRRVPGFAPGVAFSGNRFSGDKEKIMAKRKQELERRSMVLEPDVAGIILAPRRFTSGYHQIGMRSRRADF